MRIWGGGPGRVSPPPPPPPHPIDISTSHYYFSQFIKITTFSIDLDNRPPPFAAVVHHHPPLLSSTTVHSRHPLLFVTYYRRWPLAVVDCHRRPHCPPLSAAICHCRPLSPLLFAIVSHHRFPSPSLSIDDGGHHPSSLTARYRLSQPLAVGPGCLQLSTTVDRYSLPDCFFF